MTHIVRARGPMGAPGADTQQCAWANEGMYYNQDECQNFLRLRAKIKIKTTHLYENKGISKVV
jgi:hypothetical protein